MNKHLFGFGTMLVGAGLMFVLMHGEVEAESSKFTCSNGGVIEASAVPVALTSICTGHGLKCVFSIRTGVNAPSGVSCVKTGML
jgi:hypothetical protein